MVETEANWEAQFTSDDRLPWRNARPTLPDLLIFRGKPKIWLPCNPPLCCCWQLIQAIPQKTKKNSVGETEPILGADLACG